MSVSPFGDQGNGWAGGNAYPPSGGATSGGPFRQDPERPPKNKGLPPWVIAAFAVLAVAFIGLLLFQGSPSDSPEAGDSGPTTTSSPSSGATITAAVPSVLGLTEEKAVQQLELNGFSIGSITTEATDTKPAGTIIRQSPSPGSRISIAQPIDLVIAVTTNTLVPKVTGLQEAEAVQELVNAQLLVGTIREENSEEPFGVVLRQSIKTGSLVEQGTQVDLILSNGKSRIPDVSGRSPKDAETILINAGFEVRVEKKGTADSNKVLGSEPASGNYFKRGETVTIFVPSKVAPEPTPNPTPTEDPLCNSLYFYLEIEKAAEELGVEFKGIVDYKCSGQWGVVEAAFGKDPNIIYETIVIRRNGEAWERFPTEQACASPSPLPADLIAMACQP